MPNSKQELRPLEDDPAEIVRRYLADPLTGWSVGTYGAIAEFQYDPDEPGLRLDLEAMSVRTERGALAIVSLEGVQPFGLTDDGGRLREIAFCSERRGAQRATVTDLGDRTFDVGIAAPHIDMLVRLRSGDTETDAALRAGAGRPLFAADNPAGLAIARASPTRILASAVARIEVHQPIPAPGGRSPEGPHTHLLPKLLAQGRIHPPGSPLPDGLYCGLSLYPRTRL
ncbi:DUF6925 family protein [Reyranella sp.]|uniref:DUF6925 family protein n=1 Tax=Reyranella sp. TaxID=1929291 RepID=UPI003D098A77